ncbi:hypothetical protein ACWPKO_29515 (plasmid) [Coraliomargarita sp. W4R53]
MARLYAGAGKTRNRVDAALWIAVVPVRGSYRFDRCSRIELVTCGCVSGTITGYQGVIPVPVAGEIPAAWPGEQ